MHFGIMENPFYMFQSIFWVSMFWIKLSLYPQAEAEIPNSCSTKSLLTKYESKMYNNQEMPLDVAVVIVAEKRNQQKKCESPGEQKTTQPKNH